MVELERLYAAIDEDDAFNDLPATVARMCGGRSATLTRLDAGGRLSYASMSYFRIEDWTPYYESGWFQRDPWSAVAGSNAGRAVSLDDILPPAKFRETEMYNELFRSIGDDTARCTGVKSRSVQDTIVLGIHRPGAAAEFTAKNEALLDAALVHVRRVFRSRDAVAHSEGRRQTAETMLNATGQAALLVDATLRIRWVTPNALRLLDRKDGVRVLSGRLVLDDPTAHERLRRSTTGAINRHVGAPDAVLCRRSSRASYRLAILPAGEKMPGCALILLDDPAAGPDEDRFRRFAQAYNLTPAEAALARGLAEDKSLDEIAGARGVSKETVRSQLKSLFLKTGVSRQIELLKLIVRMP